MARRTGRTGRKYRIPRPSAPTAPFASSAQEFAGRIQSDLALDLPDEDLTEDLSDALEMYVPGSKPRCEEAEYLALMEDAIERIARGR